MMQSHYNGNLIEYSNLKKIYEYQLNKEGTVKDENHQHKFFTIQQAAF